MVPGSISFDAYEGAGISATRVTFTSTLSGPPATAILPAASGSSTAPASRTLRQSAAVQPVAMTPLDPDRPAWQPPPTLLLAASEQQLRSALALSQGLTNATASALALTVYPGGQWPA